MTGLQQMGSLVLVKSETNRLGAKLGRSQIALRQKTLKSAISCSGIGLHSGQRVNMTLKPAAPDSGIFFRRTDAAGKGAVIPAKWDRVTDTRLCTCLTNDDGINVRTIEHLISALAGLGIDNLEIDMTAAEVPIMDGSAAPFLFLVECAGLLEQDVPKKAIEIIKPLSIHDGEKRVSLLPAKEFSLRLEIDFPNTAINKQDIEVTLSPLSFRNEIARARTFGFDHEVAALRAAGLARGGSLDNAVVVSGDKVLNEEGLRFEDEFVRHKTLDAIGDLYLAGMPIIGHFHGVRTGHALNNRMLRELFSRTDAFKIVEMVAEASPIRAVG